LAEHLDLSKLMRLLHGDTAASTPPARPIQPDAVRAVAAWDWGPTLVARHFWRELGLEVMLDQLSKPSRREVSTLSDRAFVLVLNRLTVPGSEHGLARWLETDFVCDRDGRRWLAQWRDEATRKTSRTPRVQVEWRQLKPWYRTLDQLLERKDAIERDLYLRLRDLFSLRTDIVFYAVSHQVKNRWQVFHNLSQVAAMAVLV
jgi:hypothetical protein